MSVLVEGAAEPVASANIEAGDPVRLGDRCRQCMQRSGLAKGPVRPVFVAVQLELTQHVQKVALVPDQSAVQQIASAGLHPVPFRNASLRFMPRICTR
ncbi:hypothetical protein [Streptomyces sp. NBC_01378]|uniref:hypothetical protein n=1 Tax=Streptomyces sp. NBC_01378 TaxID=2903844 RepID=UPI00386BACD4